MFKALLLNNAPAFSASIQSVDPAGLPAGDVLVAPSYSTLNFKDGLAITNKSPVVRVWPMVAGIDGAGTVLESSHPDWKPGDAFVHNGWGVGETHWGCLAERARLKGDWLVKLPAAFTPRQAMAIGTAGYTAMLCALMLEKHGIKPADGPILVTGAAGGVGTISIAVLAKLGYEVTASTGRLEETDFLKSLGASQVIDRATLSSPGEMLGAETWAGAIDTVGSATLANVIASVKYRGAVAACGLAQGLDFPTTVLPFLLRNITLYGIDSVMAPYAARSEAWERLSTDLDVRKLESVTQVLGLDQAIPTAHEILSGKVRGRVVIDVNR